jgi:hypothetical protein
MKWTNRLTFSLHVYANEFVHYKYFLLKIDSSIVRYFYSKFSITSFEETPKHGTFSIHNNPWS